MKKNVRKIIKNGGFLVVGLSIYGFIGIGTLFAQASIDEASLNQCIQKCSDPQYDLQQCRNNCITNELQSCIAGGGNESECSSLVNTAASGTGTSNVFDDDPTAPQEQESPFDDDPTDPQEQESPFDDDPTDPTPGGLPQEQGSDLTCEEKYVQEKIFTCLDLGEDCLAQVEETYKNAVENCNQQYEDEKQQCENKVRNESLRCDAFEPGTPKREECESYLNLEEIRNECLSQALAKWNSCNAVAEVERAEGNEKCEKEEEDAYQVCVEKLRSEAEEECKKEEDKEEEDQEEEKEEEEEEEDKITSGQFDVSKFLKIEEGQTYLEEENVEKYGVVFFIVKAIEVLTKIISSFALLFVIVGGIILMVSSGNEDLQRRGKEIIKYALIGLVIAFASLLIVTFVQSLFFTI